MSTGLTEASAAAAGYEAQSHRFPLAASGRAATLAESQGVLQVVSDRGTGRVLGIHAAAPSASELAGEAALALEMGATLEDLALTIHPHPTLSEAIPEAAWLALDRPLHIFAAAERPAMAGYEQLEHTADVGLRAWGMSPAEAFEQAARGMFAIILGVDPEDWEDGRAKELLQLEVSGEDWVELLVNWLVELLFHYDAESLVPMKIAVRECAPPRCVAEVQGSSDAAGNDVGGVGVKAVTYHEIKVDVGEHRTELQVIFDIKRPTFAPLPSHPEWIGAVC